MITPDNVKEFIIQQLKYNEPTGTGYGRDAGIYVLGKVGGRKTIRGTETTNRLDPNMLELVYNKDPIAFNGTNLIVRTILSTDHYIKTDLLRDQKVIKQILPAHKLDRLLKITFKHLIIFGHAWYEMLLDKNGKVVDLETLDPKTMDYLRDDFGHVIWDKTGRHPECYTQYIPNNAPEIEGEIRIAGRRAIKLDIDNIVHFKFNDITDSSIGVGMIEPLYNTIKIKMNIELGLSQSIIRHGFPIFHAKLGDERHEPLPDQIDQMYENLQNLDESTELVTPYYNEIDILESKQTTDTGRHLDYFIDQQIAGFGVPRPLVTGGGEATNRSVLERQQVIFQQTLRDLMETVSTIYEDKIFARIVEDYNISETPKLIWEDTNIESITSKAERLQGYAGVGLLVADKPMRDYIRDKERIPAETKEDIIETGPQETKGNRVAGQGKKENNDNKEKKLHEKYQNTVDSLEKKIEQLQNQISTLSRPIDIKVEHVEQELKEKKMEVLNKLLGE
jgi:hypothetical protein